MALYDKTPYQKDQLKVINEIERQIADDSLSFSTVSPVEDYEKDNRLCLTSVHFPKKHLIDQIQEQFIEPLRKLSPSHYCYPKDNLHMTIKNIRVIADPPNFTSNDIVKAINVFDRVLASHVRFNVYFYRLLLFKSNLSLIGTTDEELDKIVIDLDRELEKVGVPDDKVYANSKNFFSNMTLVRFHTPINQELKDKIDELSLNVKIDPYEVDKVTLLSSNAVLNGKKIFGSWNLSL
jgi:2'-5' RNA ligase